MNELTNVARTGTLTVAGTTTIPAAGVTVNGLPVRRAILRRESASIEQ